MFSAKIYGDFAVKFRAFGVDFGTARRSILPADAPIIPLPFALPTTLPIFFSKFGISVNAYIVKA